jgi:hypothetical protein
MSYLPKLLDPQVVMMSPFTSSPGSSRPTTATSTTTASSKKSKMSSKLDNSMIKYIYMFHSLCDLD